MPTSTPPQNPQQPQIKQAAVKKDEKEKDAVKKEEEKTKEQLEQEKLIEQTKISLQLDRYEDIFSDFDPRPYSQRALSFDFLEEAGRAAREKRHGDLELRFLIPQERRDEHDEAVIKRRLRDYFKKQFSRLEGEMKKARLIGLGLVVTGMIMMLFATFVAYQETQTFFSYFLIVLLEPTGWFSVWYGLDHIFYTALEKKSEIEFNKKMSKAEITFSNY